MSEIKLSLKTIRTRNTKESMRIDMKVSMTRVESSE